MAKTDDRKSIRCSFCGKPQSLVDRLIAGNGSYICDECVKLCMSIVDEDYVIGEKAQKTKQVPELLQERLPKQLAHAADGADPVYVVHERDVLRYLLLRGQEEYLVRVHGEVQRRRGHWPLDVEIQEHPGKYGQPPQREHGHVPPGRKFKIIAHENTPFRELWLKCSRGDEVSSVPPVIVCNIRTRSRPRAGCV